ncbi:uncharacterized protein LOC143063224 isoform X2 [Mytilus galloprovincialis]|uniref:uncharacterized protein LOC143063224 isoform X2 n=1 Tax=Mytilus galloprovincialis TaxID=29158 RepID=UPI003F7B5006
MCDQVKLNNRQVILNRTMAMEAIHSSNTLNNSIPNNLLDIAPPQQYAQQSPPMMVQHTTASNIPPPPPGCAPNMAQMSQGYSQQGYSNGPQRNPNLWDNDGGVNFGL